MIRVGFWIGIGLILAFMVYVVILAVSLTCLELAP